MLTRIKRFFCNHTFEMKKFNLGSELLGIGMIDTYYPTCIKCGEMVMTERYSEWNPDFKYPQQPEA